MRDLCLNVVKREEREGMRGAGFVLYWGRGMDGSDIGGLKCDGRGWDEMG